MAVDFVDGNHAVARAAARAGCDFFAGYPITPASSILHHLVSLLPPTGGTVIQAEDEIAAIGMCIGAAAAGRRVMTATSGPGLSLFSESIGLAIISETPMVIVDVQRQGPATGSATKGADSDIQFVRWGTSGGLPVIALCPADPADAFCLTHRAFALAERFRCPVFVLSNKEIALTRESVDLDAIELPPIEPRRRADADATGFQPHRFDGLSAVPLASDMGGPHLVRLTTSTHDMAGELTTDPEIIAMMIDHYAAKIDKASDEITSVVEDRIDDADTLVICYGVCARSSRVAVREARQRGARVSSLVLRNLWPVPERAIINAMRGVRRVVVPELNLGQYRREIERVAPRDVEIVGINKMNTTLLSPREILDGGLLP